MYQCTVVYDSLTLRKLLYMYRTLHFAYNLEIRWTIKRISIRFIRIIFSLFCAIVFCDKGHFLPEELFYVFFSESVQKSLTADVTKESSWLESPYH